MTRYAKYICTTLQKRHAIPPPTPDQRDQLTALGVRIPMEHVHWIDGDVIPGAYYGETTWMWPPEWPAQVMWKKLAEKGYSTPSMFPHAHGFPELLSWWSANPEDPGDISPMGLQIGNEIIPLTTSWVAYVPANLPHMPVFYSGTLSQIHERPTLHWTSGPGAAYAMGESDVEGHVSQHDQGEPVGTMVDPTTSQYRGYIVTNTSPDVERPEYMRPLDPVYSRPMAYIDQTVIPDAEFGCDTRWLLPGGDAAGQIIMDTHVLPHGSTISCIAHNYSDPTDLCGEAELWLGGEKHVITKGFWAYVPPNVSQGPLIVRNITKPIALIMSFPVGVGVEKYRGGE
jgi:hypothetical protein